MNEVDDWQLSSCLSTDDAAADDDESETSQMCSGSKSFHKPWQTEREAKKAAAAAEADHTR